ncbi:MAG: hypothetical protein WCW14_00820 [Candidatus Paceibacterota bacterium]
MKKNVVGILFFIISFISSSADVSSWEDITPTLTIKTSDKFVKAPAGVVVYDKPVVQGDLSLAMPYGLYAGIWQSQAWNAKQDSIANEIDYYVGIEHKLFGYTYGLELKYWDRTALFEGPANDVWVIKERIRGETLSSKQNPSEDISFQTAITPFAEFLEFFPGRDSTFEGGIIISAGYTIELKTHEKSKCKWILEPIVGYDDGIFKKDTAVIFRGRSAIVWQISKNLQMVLPEYTFVEPTSNNDSRRTINMISAGMTWKM